MGSAVCASAPEEVMPDTIATPPSSIPKKDFIRSSLFVAALSLIGIPSGYATVESEQNCSLFNNGTAAALRRPVWISNGLRMLGELVDDLIALMEQDAISGRLKLFPKSN